MGVTPFADDVAAHQGSAPTLWYVLPGALRGLQAWKVSKSGRGAAWLTQAMAGPLGTRWPASIRNRRTVVFEWEYRPPGPAANPLPTYDVPGFSG